MFRVENPILSLESGGTQYPISHELLPDSHLVTILTPYETVAIRQFTRAPLTLVSLGRNSPEITLEFSPQSQLTHLTFHFTRYIHTMTDTNLINSRYLIHNHQTLHLRSQRQLDNNSDLIFHLDLVRYLGLTEHNHRYSPPDYTLEEIVDRNTFIPCHGLSSDTLGILIQLTSDAITIGAGSETQSLFLSRRFPRLCPPVHITSHTQPDIIFDFLESVIDPD